MIEVIRAAAELQALCESQHWRFCFIGGLALQRWGEPRETIDVDLTLLTGFGGEEPFIRTLLQHFDARIENAVNFALTRRVLLARTRSGVGLDIALGGLPFEESVIARSSLFPYPPETLLRTCSAEDLIVMKAFAARGKDWLDVEGIIVRQTGKLDWAYIRDELQPLAELKEAPGIMEELQRRRVEFEQ
ncbi:MAG: nucleotidyl transferase AbiEii/AbiGii toxin family protein [Thermoguttaceae bacterium]